MSKCGRVKSLIKETIFRIGGGEATIWQKLSVRADCEETK